MKTLIYTLGIVCMLSCEKFETEETKPEKGKGKSEVDTVFITDTVFFRDTMYIVQQEQKIDEFIYLHQENNFDLTIDEALKLYDFDIKIDSTSETYKIYYYVRGKYIDNIMFYYCDLIAGGIELSEIVVTLYDGDNNYNDLESYFCNYYSLDYVDLPDVNQMLFMNDVLKYRFIFNDNEQKIICIRK